MKRFNIVSNGYDIEEVNQFIDVVISRLEKLNEENNQYLKIINDLKKNSNNNLDTKSEKIDNDKLAKALLAAEDTSLRMKELARREAEVVLDDAKRNANSIIHESLIEAQKNEQEAAILKKNIEVYKTRLKSLLNNQLEMLDDIDKVEL
jgi:cell division initiation protein